MSSSSVRSALRTVTPNPRLWFTAAYWTVEYQPSSFAPSSRFSNLDMDVVPPHLRTWRAWDFLFLWCSDGLNVGTMQQAGSMIALGLSWKEVLPALFIGNFIIALAVTANGLSGAKFHAPFSVIARSSFGFFGSYVPVISRLVLALIYFGINSQIGSSCVKIMLSSIWPSFKTMPNHLPLSAGITSSGMVAYFVFWCIQLPLLMIPPRKMRYLFMFKSFIVIIAAFAMLGWSIKKAGGSGPIFATASSLTGTKKAWAWVSILNAAISGKTTLAINNPDLSRYARRVNDQYWQVLFITVTYGCLSLVGIVIASASKVIYGTAFWDPTQIIALWPNRAASFFVATAFMLAQAGTNISTNSIASSNDLTFLFPKYVNIKRGAFITAVLGGWATAPWKIQASGTILLNFLSGYAIVLAPLLAILIVDYFLIKGRKLNVPDLYRPTGIYSYGRWGVNWRPFVALLFSVTPNIPGLAAKLNTKVYISDGMRNYYSFAWLNSFFISSVVYFIVAKTFPARETIISEEVWDDNEEEEGEGSSEDMELKKEGGVDGEGLPWDGQTTSSHLGQTSEISKEQVKSL
ncbi:allantoin permease [Mrakia frigida]|uniref:nucleobase cation symporter-1 family protein n=1 Tax=Mrakia frigida TaxID=29902 RepID=UPI003FCC2670